MEDDLDHTVWAKNMEIRRYGETSFMIMTRKNPGIPGMTAGNELTDDNINASDKVKLHFKRQKKSRALWFQASSDRRIKELQHITIQFMKEEMK